MLLVICGCGQTAAAPEALNLALYGHIPGFETFAETVKAHWQARHPETALTLV